MASEDAHYLHASLYSFGFEARRDVLSTFNASVQDVSARCSYDVALDVRYNTRSSALVVHADTESQTFYLTCPQPLGPVANEALWKAIADCVENELAAAHREEVDIILLLEAVTAS